MDAISADDVRRALASADFPAGKEELLEVAGQAGADDAVLRALRALPPVEYRNVDEVVRSVETVEATGETRSERPAKARVHRKPGLAEHMRSIER